MMRAKWLGLAAAIVLCAASAWAGPIGFEAGSNFGFNYTPPPIWNPPPPIDFSLGFTPFFSGANSGSSDTGFDTSYWDFFGPQCFIDGPNGWYGLDTGTFAPTSPTPEPCSWLLLATGLLSLGGYLGRKRFAL